MLGHYTTGLRKFRRRERSWTYRLLPPGRDPPPWGAAGKSFYYPLREIPDS